MGDLQPDTRGDLATPLIVYCAVGLVIILVPVSLRFYIRIEILRKFGHDDTALALTVLSTICSAIGASIATRFGLGSPVDNQPDHEKTIFLKLIFFAALGYHVTIILLKSAFVLQFRRVFPLPAFQRLCDFSLVFLAAWAVAGLVGGLLICLPLPKNWDPREPAWTCRGRLWFWTGHGIVHVITDVLIFIMPMPLLRTLPLPRAHKMILIGVFSLGFCTCVISGLRLTTLRGSLQGRNVTWTSAKTVFWSLGEVTCSIVCLCIPTLRPLLGAWGARRAESDNNIRGRGRQRFASLSDAVRLPSTVSTPRQPDREPPDPPESTSNNI